MKIKKYLRKSKKIGAIFCLIAKKVMKPNQGYQILITVSLQGKLASRCGCRVGIVCPKETPDRRLLVGKITCNTHRCPWD